MATKSDFAQKLLNDLRHRKERMGVSQGSARNHATARDAYRDPGNIQRRSRHTKSLELGGSKSTNQQLISSRRSDQALNIKETSQQLVSYSGRQHQRSDSIGDLSMAFTYAVKHGGKLMNVDFSSSNNTNTMIDFLNQISRRSLDAGNATSLVKHRPSNGAPALTTIQIKEISKGVQNLYEIIRSTSNGTSVNRYSMEVGKELLKGAKGLEESLRMLVNLQEASDSMVNPQRKSRITLLEVDDDGGEDERSKTVERKQVALPRFSFDKPSKRSNFPITESDACSKFPAQQWSATGDAENVRSVSSANPTSIRSEKGRISNVIAKLMGLEEIPVKVDSYPRPDEFKKAYESSVNKTSRPVKDGAYSKRDEIKKADKKMTKMISRPMKDPKPHDSNTNGESRTNQSNKNSRLDRIPEKQEKHSKRRNLEATSPVHDVEVEKKKTTVGREKSKQIQEPERRSLKSKQDSNQIKPVKNTNLVSKLQLLEENQKAKYSPPKAQEHERTRQKMAPVARKKVDLVAVGRTRTKDEVLRRTNRTLNSLSTPSKHKLLVLKESERNEVHIRSEPEEFKTKRLKSVQNANEAELTTGLYDIVPVFKNETKSDPPQVTSEIVDAVENAEVIPHESHISETKSKKASYSNNLLATSKIIVAGKNAEIPYKSNLPENKPKKAFYSSVQVVLTEQEKQLKEILIKDQLFLSTAEALFKLNIPVGFLHVDDHNHHNNETKLKLDCGYEILKRKARSQELSVHPYIKPSIADTSIRFLDELVKQLHKDLEGIRLYGRDTHNEYDQADYLYHMLEKDIHNKNPDINSFWDFGWDITTFTFVEKDEFVSDMEQDMLCGLVDEIIDDLLSM